MAGATGVWTCAALLVCAAGAGFAQDGAPPLVDMADRQDAGKIVAIALPAAAQDVTPPEADPDRLAAWGIDLNAKPSKPQIYVYVFQRPGAARAALASCADRLLMNFGNLVPGSEQAKPGEWTEKRTSDKSTFEFRYVESGGAVYVAVAQCSNSNYPRLKGHMATIVAGLKVVGAPPKPTPPAGFKSSTVGGVELWTDAKGDVCEKILKQHAQAWELMKKILPGDPVVTAPPRVIVCGTDAGFVALTGLGKSLFTMVISRPRALVVRATGLRDPEFAAAVQRASALHYVRLYFGGKAPEWIESGLRMICSIGLSEAGRVELAPKNVIEAVRATEASGRWKLSDLFDMTSFDEPKRNDYDHLLWAWHWYFRLGPDVATFGAAYAAELRKLRETGDAAGAHKAAWDGVDLAKVQDAFDAWLPDWHK